MRIILAAEFWFGATGAGLAHGFRRLGWDVDEVDLRNHLLQGRTPVLRLASRALRRYGAASYNRAVLEAIDTLQPRAFLTVKGTFLTPGTLAEISRRGVMTINYYPDFHFGYPDIDRATFRHYDLMFTTKSFQLDYLRGQLEPDRVRFLHHGYSSLVHRPRLAEVTEADYVADVLYVGNYSPYKERWFEAIASELPAVKLMIVGNGWGAATPELTRCITGSVLTGDSYARILQRARINLALHSGPSGPDNWEDLVSTRTFEIPACKGFMLHIDNDEVRGLFEPGHEIDVFAAPDGLCEKISYYLARPELRRRMIERAFARCVPAYSYDERAQAIAEAIGTP